MAQRSKRYQAAIKKVDSSRDYSLEEAVGIIKDTATTKFDSSIEIHANLGIDPKQGDQQVRSSLSLPHGTGKTQRVAVFTSNPDAAKKAGADIAGGDDLIKDIQTTKKIDFDIAIAEPAMMKNMAPIAKILGPKGLMPSPKSGTVTQDIEKAITEIKQGRVNFKNDDTGNVHSMIGRASFSAQDLLENIQAFIEALKRSKPDTSKGAFIRSVTISSSMGPGIKVKI
ncbi:MAG TPA: 50S ribosomal protein L1 [Patescibacteria group bacterium]|nr:50S ribosomal protein L1 [Patescibacteria group bacterium]